MPYVDRDARVYLKNPNASPQTIGELNYVITSLVITWLLNHDLNYMRINEAIGVLEAAKLELYRRVAVPYENQKIEDNGDVYPVELTQGGQK